MLNPYPISPGLIDFSPAIEPVISPDSPPPIFSCPNDVLCLIGRLLPRQDAINFTSACTRLFNLRFEDRGYGILYAQWWNRMPDLNEAISSKISFPAWPTREGGRMLKNDAPGITQLTLHIDNTITELNFVTLISTIQKLRVLKELDIRNTWKSEKHLCRLLEGVIAIPLPITRLSLNLYVIDLHTTLSRTFNLIAQLTALRALEIEGGEVLSEIRQLTGLESLIIDSDDIEVFPVEIGQLTKLRYLTVKGMLIGELPKQMGQLRNLQSLAIEGQSFGRVPKQIGQLSNLQSFSIEGESFESLPREIGQLSNLQRLTIKGQSYISLTKEIGQLSKLWYLKIEAGLGEIPKEIYQLNNLHYLLLKAVGLREIPKEIDQLNNLHYLTIDSHGLKSLPREIGQLSHLQNLKIRGHSIESLPEEISQLTCLQKLTIRVALTFATLPIGLSQLRCLQNLTIDAIKLTTLPAEITQLTELRVFKIRSNSAVITDAQPIFKQLKLQGTKLEVTCFDMK